MALDPPYPLPSAAEVPHGGGFHPGTDLDTLRASESTLGTVAEVLAVIAAADRRLAEVLWTDLRTHDRQP